MIFTHTVAKPKFQYKQISTSGSFSGGYKAHGKITHLLSLVTAGHEDTGMTITSWCFQ